MKKFLIGILTLILGMSGYAIVDKTIEDRVETLESQVSELQEDISNLQTTVVVETEAATTKKVTMPEEKTANEEKTTKEEKTEKPTSYTDPYKEVNTK